MATLKNNRIRTGIALFLLLFGAFFIVKAMDKKEVKENTLVNQWFQFTGTSTDSPTDQTKYELIEEGAPLPECNPGDQVCVLNAEVGANNKPVIDANLESEIMTATTNQEHSTNVRVRE